MRHPVLLIFVNAMILIVVFALLTQSLFITQRLAQARVVSGRVEVQRGGKGGFTPLAANAFVKSGDIVRTTDGSAEFTWAGGTRWKVMPNTLVKLKKATGSGRAELSQLQVTSGKVFVRIARALSPGSRFEVETPQALASVRGTIFSVEARGEETRVRVWKGAVTLSGRGGQKISVAPGEAGRVSGSPSGDSVVTALPDSGINTEFESQPSIARPELEADVRALSGKRALAWGTSEAGDEVLVNGQSARVLGNGAFRLEMARPRDGRFKITSTDRHGASSTWLGSLRIPRAQQTPIEAR